MQHGLIGVGIVGYGYWGPNMVRNFINNMSVRVLAISDLKSDNLAICNRLYPNILTTTDFKDLIQNPWIDAIVIATPVHTHYELAMAALKAGKHVLVEKPLAQTSGQVRRLIDEAERRKLVLMVDHTFLYTPSVQKLRELIVEKSLGEIYYYDSIRASLGLFQNDVNVIWDLAVHDMSIIRYILDEEPVAVSATAASHVEGSPENMAHITLFFSSSCVAHISVNWLSPIKLRQIFVGGSRKMVMYDDLETVEKIKIYDKGVIVSGNPETKHQLRIGYRAGDMWAPHLMATEALQAEAQHFVDCIISGTSPISNGLSGLSVVETLEAACLSIAARGNPIQLPSDCRRLVS